MLEECLPERCNCNKNTMAPPARDPGITLSDDTFPAASRFVDLPDVTQGSGHKLQHQIKNPVRKITLFQAFHLEPGTAIGCS